MVRHQCAVLTAILTGTEAAFMFVQPWGMDPSGQYPSSVAPSSGATIQHFLDEQTKRLYLVVAEGGGNKVLDAFLMLLTPLDVTVCQVRMIDVTDNKENATVVTTLASVVGPLAMVLGNGQEAFVFDSQGLLTALDFHPLVKCGVQNHFYGDALNLWMPSEDVESTTMLGPAQHIYDLRRAGAANSSSPFPWEFSVQKKLVRTPVMGTLAMKMTTCARKRQSDRPFFCCVRKRIHFEDHFVESDNVEAQAVDQAKLQKALLDI